MGYELYIPQIINHARQRLSFENEQVGIFSLSKSKDFHLLAIGNLTFCNVSRHKFFSCLFEKKITHFVLIHTHVQSDCLPSFADFKSTKKILTACNELEMNFYDHIILNESSHFRFRLHFKKLFR